MNYPSRVEFLQFMIPWGAFCRGPAANLAFEFPTIIGANNDPLVCGLTYPMLSSVSIPWDNFGQFVGSSMQKMLDGESGWKRTLHLIQPSGVVFRHSANHLAVRDKTLRRALSFMERIKRADYGKHSLRPVADRPAKFGEKVQGIL